MNTSLAMLVLRLALGPIMFAHGAQKLFGWFGGNGPEGFLGWVSSMGIPAPIGWLAILAEFVGGIAVTFGTFARLAAIAIAIDMLVAMLMVHAKNGFFMSGSPDRGDGIEFTLMLCAAALAVAIAGPGRYAVAPELEMKWKGRREPRALPRAA